MPCAIITFFVSRELSNARASINQPESVLDHLYAKLKLIEPFLCFNNGTFTSDYSQVIGLSKGNL